MKTTPFFNVSLLNDSAENLNDLKLHTYMLLGKVFAAVSVIVCIISLLVPSPHAEMIKETCSLILLAICFFCLVSGTRDLRHWNFKLELTFTIAFGIWAYLLLEITMLMFTVSVAAFCFCAALACRLWHNRKTRKVSSLIAPAAMTIIIWLLFATYKINGIFLASVAATQLLLFWLLTILFFKQQAKELIIANANSNYPVSSSVFLIATYELLGFLIFLIGLMLWIAF